MVNGYSRHNSHKGAIAPPLGVVLTAGMGTRLRPLTPDLPKSLVPLLNRPLVAYSLDAMAALGIDDVVVVVGPGDAHTAEVARRLAPRSMRVAVAVQQSPRGPGDAVLSAGAALDGRPVAVLAVDTVLTHLDASAMQAFLANDAAAGLLLQSVADPRAFGVAVLAGDRVVQLEEKPAVPSSNLALVGLWLLRPRAIERVRDHPVINAKGESDLTATVATFVERDCVLGWTFNGAWLDGGTLEGLLHAQGALLRSLAPGHRHLADSALVRRSYLDAHVLIGDGARVDGSDIAQSVIGADAIVRDATLHRVLVAPGATVIGGAYEDVVITRAGVVAGPGARAATAMAR